jgi:FG-GAP repeat
MAKLFFTLLFSFAIICTQAQNIGIGTTNPTEKLEVTGNVKADTVKPAALKFIPNAGVGKILTSDAVGNAAWADAKSGGVGFGAWGGCDVTGVNEYNPVADDSVAANDFFGISESISGNFAIIGANLDNIGSNIDQGSASIYKYDGSNWVFFKKLIDATGQASDEFGWSVSISGDYAVVGARVDDIGANINQGSVSVYKFDGTDWVFMQRLTDPIGLSIDEFGSSVSISGNYIAVGATNGNAGSSVDFGTVSIFKFDGVNWVFMQKISDVTGATGDEFGYAVSISGNQLIVGAPFDDVGVNADQGSASFFRYNGTNWVLVQKITNALGTSGDLFGRSVSVVSNYAVIGEPSNGVGIGNIYRYNGINWALMQSLTEASSGGFANRVAVSENYILIGASSELVGVNASQGAAYLYIRVGGMWQKVQRITDPVGTANANFGLSVAIDGSIKRFLIGAYRAAPGGKAIFGKVN